MTSGFATANWYACRTVAGADLTSAGIMLIEAIDRSSSPALADDCLLQAVSVPVESDIKIKIAKTVLCILRIVDNGSIKS